jgi:hypothetical protein
MYRLGSGHVFVKLIAEESLRRDQVNSGHYGEVAGRSRSAG